MSEYKVWIDNKEKISTSIVAIRKAIMKRPKSYIGYNIFYGSQVVARMFWGSNEWIYRDFRKGITYTVKKDGHIWEGRYDL